MTKPMIIPVQNESTLGKDLCDLYNVLLEVTKEHFPEYYAWSVKWEDALRKERLAREKRMKIQAQEPPLE